MKITPSKCNIIPEKMPEDKVKAQTQPGRKRHETRADSAPEKATDGRMTSRRADEQPGKVRKEARRWKRTHGPAHPSAPIV